MEKSVKNIIFAGKNTFSRIYRYVLGTFLGDAISLKVFFQFKDFASNIG